MFSVIIKRSDDVIHEIECDSLCLSYDDDGRISSVVSMEPDISVSTMSLLGCSASSACLRAINQINDNDGN